MDRAGNFIGWLFVDAVNMSQLLLEKGLSRLHFTAERSSYYRALQQAEENAKNKRIKVREYLKSVACAIAEPWLICEIDGFNENMSVAERLFLLITKIMQLPQSVQLKFFVLDLGEIRGAGRDHGSGGSCGALGSVQESLRH